MKMKKFILAFAVMGCLAAAGGFAAVKGETAASAEEATAAEYTVVDTPMMVKINNEYVDNGNFNVVFTLSQTDYNGVNEGVAVENLTGILQEFGFFDNVMIGEKTLRELGCTGLWKETLAYGVNEPQNIVRVHCHADPETWKTAYNNGEIDFSKSVITVKEGMLLPGYTYLTGAEDPIVYRASCEYQTEESIVAYSRETNGKTDVEDLKFTQAWDGSTAYVGVSLKGDDFLGDGSQLTENENHQYHYASDYHETILINGEEELVKYYGIYNLGEAGLGYYSFAIYLSEEECQSITIPAGTRFPSRAMQELKSINNGNTVFITYKTQTDMTFVNTQNGFMLLEDYKKAVEDELIECRSEKADADYFSVDVAAMNEALESAKTALVNADTVAAIDEIAANCKMAIDSVSPKTDVIAAAKSDVESYKAEEGYFRAEEEALRLQYVETAILGIENAESKEDLETVVLSVKAEIDTLKTAAQYADEELAPLKASAYETIENYLSQLAYFSEERAVIEAARADGSAAVANARTEEEIESAVNGLKETMDSLTTKETYVNAAKEELNAYTAGVFGVEDIISTAFTGIENADSKAELDGLVIAAKAAVDEVKNASAQAARDAVNAKKASVLFDEYSAENQATINALYKAAKDAIASAATQEDLDNAVANFIAGVDGLEKLPAPKEERGKKGGCGSSLGLSAAIGLIVGAGAVLVGKKRED